MSLYKIKKITQEIQQIFVIGTELVLGMRIRKLEKSVMFSCQISTGASYQLDSGKMPSTFVL